MSIKIVLADDHSIVREGIKQLLEMDNDYTIIGECGNGTQAISMIRRKKPDVVLLDINMPDISGMDVLRKLKSENSKTKYIFLTMHDEPEYIVKTLEYGGDGYILKDSDSSLLKQAIDIVYRGERFIQPSMIPMLNAKLIKKERNSDALTSREIEILKLVAYGMPNKQIADKLNITERTVKNHVTNIFRKIDVSDRTHAALYAIKNDYVSV